jgi:hypothetical protein
MPNDRLGRRHGQCSGLHGRYGGLCASSRSPTPSLQRGSSMTRVGWLGAFRTFFRRRDTSATSAVGKVRGFDSTRGRELSSRVPRVAGRLATRYNIANALPVSTFRWLRRSASSGVRRRRGTSGRKWPVVARSNWAGLNREVASGYSDFEASWEEKAVSACCQGGGHNGVGDITRDCRDCSYGFTRVPLSKRRRRNVVRCGATQVGKPVGALRSSQRPDVQHRCLLPSAAQLAGHDDRT